ncbi:SHOCT domain-containing protein [Magnetovibrio blakemorei]|uniref:SHOCT domain-containing protein n=1 Tax=Magnetovibrio blakemorei TaxID=28181 RepID=A0A1E5QAS5_9PROT|nr:SHOCT domain-containing protein [Magnetovibrio blakemorei]OEJ69002.1 hypothetical protein BEN30_04590 [Magnetovibrio blakemorei]
MNIKSIRVFAAGVVALPILTTGCSSVTGTVNQSVSVETHGQTGTEVVGASCELTNNKGKWFIQTPGSTTIHRSNDDMQVLCKKESMENGRAAVVSDVKGSMFGNIVFGGGVGAIIDHSNGSAYEYPPVIDVVMGSFSKIETPKNPSAQQDNDKPAEMQSLTASTKTEADNQTPTKDSTSQKLRDLLALRNDNVITEDEFQQKKKALLESL